MSRNPAQVFVRCLLVLGLLFMGACKRDDVEGEGSNRKPNVLLITFDTTRADHLGPYGYEAARTPTLDRLARRSVTFKRAFTPSPMTLPAHTTILTGLFPFYHGVRNNSHFVAGQKLNTLAEALKAQDYQTAAFVAAFVLDSRFGLDQGFDHYDDNVRPKEEFSGFSVPERSAESVTDRTIAWLDQADPDKPFFIWSHYYDPHAPYNAPESFTRFPGDPYDVEISYADHQLGRLLKHITTMQEKIGNVMVVFAGDHGEALGQYGEPTHAYFAYDSTLHVPLIIHMPDGAAAGTEVEHVVSLADVLPTILDTLEMPVPGEGQVHGKSLLPLFLGSPPEELLERPIAFENLEPNYAYGWAQLVGVRVGEKKYIETTRPELYFLSESLKEIPENNRYGNSPEEVERLKIAMRELYDTELAFPSLSKAPQKPDQEVIDQLRALGYVAADINDAPDEKLADLKDMLPTFRRALDAMAMIGGGEMDNAADEVLRLLEEHPRNRRLQWLLAVIATQSKSAAERAVPVLQAALENKQVEPGMVAQLLLACGQALFYGGDEEAALKHFKDTIEAQPDYATAMWWQGLIYARRGATPEALSAFSKAAKQFGKDAITPQISHALALLASDKPAEGDEIFKSLIGSSGRKARTWELVAAFPVDEGFAIWATPAMQKHLSSNTVSEITRKLLAVAAAKYLARQGEFPASLKALELTRSYFGEKDGRFLGELGTAHLRMGRIESGTRLLETALSLSPNRTDIAGTLAVIRRDRGDVDGALKLLSDYHESHPNDPIAANNLAWMLAEQGKELDRALKIANSVVERMPGNSTVHDTLGWVLHLKKDHKRSLHHFKRAVQINAYNANYHYHLALAYRANGQEKEATEALAEAVRIAPMPRPNWYKAAKQELDS